MAEIKVSQLPTATSMLGPDLLMIVSGTSNKKITFENMVKSVRTDLVVNSNNEAASLRVFSLASDDLLITDPVLGRVGVGTTAPGALLHVNGNLKVGAEDGSGVVLNSFESLIVDGTPTKSAVPGIGVSRITFSSGNTALNVNLSNGSPYQTKTFIVSEEPSGGTCNVSILPTPWVGAGTAPSIKLTKLGDTVTLIYDQSGWAIQSYFGASIV
jgi:hypothetical protein